MLFEGRPNDGSVLPAAFDRPWSTEGSPKVQHFELAYGGNFQAVLKYRIEYAETGYVEYWIKNALDFSDARCRFIVGSKVGEWRVHSALYTGNGPNAPVFLLSRRGHAVLTHGWLRRRDPWVEIAPHEWRAYCLGRPRRSTGS